MGQVGTTSVQALGVSNPSPSAFGLHPLAREQLQDAWPEAEFWAQLYREEPDWLPWAAAKCGLPPLDDVLAWKPLSFVSETASALPEAADSTRKSRAGTTL